MQSKNSFFISMLCLILVYACTDSSTHTTNATDETVAPTTSDAATEGLKKYVPVKLTTDLSALTDKEKQMIPILIEAADLMNGLFLYQAYGEQFDVLKDAQGTSDLKKFIDINYGPWDRLEGNEAFVKGVGKKPDGANFYPQNMTKDEFEKADLKDKESLYTFLRRDANGNLITVPYHQQFKTQLSKASQLLAQAADLAEDAGLKKYLSLRSKALLDDDYQASDFAWLDMKTNKIDVVIGPIETYEDQLYGYKAAYEGYVLVKDMEWSKRLAKYAAFLPDLQKGLPVPPEYKKESPGTDTELNAYDAVYYAGDCNAGSKTIAINLPNDEEVQLKKGTRRLQLKNTMKAKFDKILVPISKMLITPDQRKHITFDAFFANTMFHEVAHGLGIKNTIDGKGTVRKALKEHASALEEGKADMLGLYMIQQLHEQGEVEGDIKDYLVTFMTSIFRSVRFGASSAHGKANMIRFNFFKEQGAFERNPDDGTYRINFEKFEAAGKALSEKILTLQGDGDYDGVAQLVAEKGKINEQLQKDLDRLSEANIPVDIIFEQGVKTLGL